MKTSRRASISLCAVFALSFLIAPVYPEIIPPPKESIRQDGLVKISGDWSIVTGSKEEEVFVLAEYLRDQMGSRFGLALGIKQAALGAAKCIELGLLGKGIEGKGKEAYTLEISGGGISINGNSPAGIFYGIQSLLQLASGDDIGVMVSAVKITDYPALKYRGVHICSADLKQIKEQLETMAEMKLNLAIIDNWGYYDLDNPQTRRAFQDIFDHARKLYIEPVPEIANFGPGGPILLREPYAAEGIYEKDEPFVFVNDKAVSMRPSKHSLVNVIRGGDSDITVKSLDGSKTYREGSDYRITDGDMAYPYPLSARSSTVNRIASGRIKDHEKVLVSYDYVECKSVTWAPWSIPYCPSSDLTYKAIFHAVDNVVNALNPRFINIGHDEVRGMNRDSRCIDRGMTNAELFADDINKIYDYVKSADSGITILMWDDMINPWHNGNNESYQIEFGGPAGSTGAAVDLIPKDVVLMVWWYDAADWLSVMRNGPRYFESKGFTYLGAAYKDRKNIEDWEKIVKGRSKCAGLITTTWDGWDKNTEGIRYTAEKSW